MQRLGIGLTLLGLVFGLAGCRTGSPPPAPTLEQAVVVITFADYESNRRVYEPLIAQFHELHPTVEIQFVPLEETLGGEGYNPLNVASAADTVLGRGCCLCPTPGQVLGDARSSLCPAKHG